MAKRRVINRKELREQNDAAEAREQKPADEVDVEEESSDGEAAATPKKKKKKAPGEAKPRAKRSRAAPARQRLVWLVLDNSHKPVQTFEYPHLHDAEELAAKLTADKKSTHFVQPVKDDIKA
jgi:hypothetical protein